MRRNQRGFTLLEMVLVLASGLIVIGLVIAPFLRVDASARALSFQRDLLAIQAAIRKLSPTHEYTGISASMLANSGLLPEAMTDGATLVTPWGAPITIAAFPIDGRDRAFTIRVGKLPVDVCATLVSNVQGAFPRINAVPGNATIKDELTSPRVDYKTNVAAQICSLGARLEFTST